VNHKLQVVCDVLEELGPEYEVLRTVLLDGDDSVKAATSVIRKAIEDPMVSGASARYDYDESWCFFCDVGDSNIAAHAHDCPNLILRCAFNPAFKADLEVRRRESEEREARWKAGFPERSRRARRAALIQGERRRRGVLNHLSLCVCHECRLSRAVVDAQLAIEASDTKPVADPSSEAK
jgi:hypothetical protein